MNRLNRVLPGALALLLLADCAASDPSPDPGEKAPAPRNVVFMLGDGMGFAQVKAYRMYADNPATELVEPLPMEAYQVGSVSTDSIRLSCNEDKSDCVRDPHGFTDSASSATAYATGQDTIVGHISTTGEGDSMPTVLEGAKRAGKLTGMVATSQITHASPAAFGSHVKSRSNMTAIADQYFDRQWNESPMLDILLGGGTSYLRRGDRDLIPEFSEAGYNVVWNRQQLLQNESQRLIGLFAEHGMTRAWDRDSDVPSLADMTVTALQALNKNPEGFFLLIEGSQVDWGAHENSVVDVISEMEDFIRAVEKVVDFARSRNDTLVIITADHETGGMALGRDGIYRWDARPLRGVKHTPAWMARQFVDGKKPLSTVVSRHVPFDLSVDESSLLDSIDRDHAAATNAIIELFNQRTFTGWTTSGHTGIDVPLYVFGPGASQFGGVMQNEDVGRALWRVFFPEKH